jgi:hypothetical protein
VGHAGEPGDGIQPQSEDLPADRGLADRAVEGRHPYVYLDGIVLKRSWAGEVRNVAAFPDGQSALNLAAARLRHIAGTRWSAKRYLNMNLLRQQMLTTQTA